MYEKIIVQLNMMASHDNHICHKTNLLILLKEPSTEKALLTLHVTTETHLFCQNVCDALNFLLENIFI